jgi:hypothetical protein
MESLKFLMPLKEERRERKSHLNNIFQLYKIPITSSESFNFKVILPGNRRSQNRNRLCPFLGRRLVYDTGERVQIDWQ